MREVRTGRHLAIFLVVLAVVGAACDDDDNANSATTSTSTTSTSTTVAVSTTVDGEAGAAGAGVTSRRWARAWTQRATRACGGRRCAVFRARRPRRPAEEAAASNFRIRYHPRRDRNGRGWRVIVRFARQVEGCNVLAQAPARPRRVGC
jgi:hypothetical protein